MPQKVRVPLRVIVGSYSNCVLPVYVKVAALERKYTGCEAGVSYLAKLLGMGESTVERALTEMMRPDPADDVVELNSARRTWEVSGTGLTAVRWMRKVCRSEHGAWVPTRAAEALNARELRCYAAISYGTAIGQDITLAELGHILRHRSGKKAGQALDPRSVRRILRRLEELGWISVERRAGYRGRHIYTVHDEPVQAPLTADIEEGSAGDLGEGSLQEDHHQTDSPDEPPAAALGIRRRREQVAAREPVENPPLPAAFKAPYAGPALSLAPRIWRVLEPVKSLLPGLSPYVVRALAREVSRQLDEGADGDVLRARLQFRFASTETIRDPGRWLLGAALRPPAPGPHATWRPPDDWHECEACRAPSRTPFPDGVCRTCRPPDLTTLINQLKGGE